LSYCHQTFVTLNHHSKESAGYWVVLEIEVQFEQMNSSKLAMDPATECLEKPDTGTAKGSKENG
jgi:hypothetical protein